MRLGDNSIVTVLIKFKFLSLVLYLLSTFLTVSYDTEKKNLPHSKTRSDTSTCIRVCKGWLQCDSRKLPLKKSNIYEGHMPSRLTINSIFKSFTVSPCILIH